MLYAPPTLEIDTPSGPNLVLSDDGATRLTEAGGWIICAIILCVWTLVCLAVGWSVEGLLALPEPADVQQFCGSFSSQDDVEDTPPGSRRLHRREYVSELRATGTSFGPRRFSALDCLMTYKRLMLISLNSGDKKTKGAALVF